LEGDAFLLKSNRSYAPAKPFDGRRRVRVQHALEFVVQVAVSASSAGHEAASQRSGRLVGLADDHASDPTDE